MNTVSAEYFTAIKIHAQRPLTAPYRKCDPQALLQQIGAEIWAISGGRWFDIGEGLALPNARGNWVIIHYMGDDTYTVRHATVRKNIVRWKRTWTNVYAENVAQIAYLASCWEN